MPNRFLLIAISVALLSAPSVVQADEVMRMCKGNIETGSRQVVQAGVSYKLSYDVSGSSARIRFAGREFDANVDTGKSWTGQWIKRIDSEIYFSYLPEDGGTIKFQFSPDRWYSGNC